MDPKQMTIEEYNSLVRGWTVKTRSRMSANAPAETGQLKSSISYALGKNFGHISKIRYSFPRHGVFVHYGVGRGYVRQGGIVIKTAKSHGFNRNPDDWFDVEIRNGIGQLAGYVQEFYGDLAMQLILEKTSRFLIEK